MNPPGATSGPAPNVLFISPSCHYCDGAKAVAELPKYRGHVEIVDVTKNQDTYKRMVDANVFQTPTMKTPSGLIAGGPQIADYLQRTYG